MVEQQICNLLVARPIRALGSMDLTPLMTKEVTKFGMNHFVITGNIPGDRGVRTIRIGIACDTIDTAISAVRERHPKIVINAISHQGPLEIVISQ